VSVRADVSSGRCYGCSWIVVVCDWVVRVVFLG